MTDKGPAIHSVDKVLMRCANVPNNWHNYCTLEADSVQNSSHDYDCSQCVDWAECGIASVAKEMRMK